MSFIICVIILSAIFTVKLFSFDTIVYLKTKCPETYSKIQQCQYGPYQNVTNGDKCEDFPRDMKENLRVVSNYRFNIDATHLERLQLDNSGIELLSAEEYFPTLPVMVTAASENHWDESQAFFKKCPLASPS